MAGNIDPIIIPGSLKGAVPKNIVTDAEFVYDIHWEGGGENQHIINTWLRGKIEDLEALAEISIEGGTIQIATAADFYNPTPEQRSKVPTVGAIIDGYTPNILPTTGDVNTPVFVNLLNKPEVVTGIKLPNSIISQNGNIEAWNGGVVAYGIADLAYGGYSGGGSGDTGAIKFDPSVVYIEGQPYTPDAGVIALPPYPNVSSKADKIIGGVTGNLITIDANGNIADAGVNTSSFATSAQGSKADTAIQGIRVNDGSVITPDANKIVNITDVASANTLAALINGLSNAGNHSLPIYFSANATPSVIDSLQVPGNIQSTNGGVSAYGIADLSISGAGTGGDVTSIKFNPQVQYQENTPYTATSGLVNLPSYPTWATLSGKPILATVATTGSYNDLSDKPSIPQGTVTSIGITVPTGLSVSPSAITTSGTFAITLNPDYSIPTIASQNAWDAKYDKPSDGIPKTDLASAVQTSLGKADSAIQGIKVNSGSVITPDANKIVKITDVASAATLSSHIGNTNNPHQVEVLVDGNQIKTTNGTAITVPYADVAGKVGTSDVGSASLPIYLASGVPTVINSLEVAGNIQSTQGGVSAYGIADLSLNGGGGSGTLTQIQINGAQIPDSSGIVNITAVSGSYPGAISIAGQRVSVYGLGSAAFANATDFLTAHQAIYALTIKNSDGGTEVTYDPKTSASTLTLTKAMVGLGSVKDQAITVTSTSVSDGTTTFNKYVHPTDAGYKHIPSGGSSGQLLGYGGSSGTASWVDKPSYNFSEIGNTPTTLEGYGITDGVNAVSVTGNGNAVTTASVSGHTMTLTKGSSFKTVQSAVNDPSASGTAIDFIATISQNTNGVISATKKTVRDASQSQSGIVNTTTQTFAGAKTFNSTVTVVSDITSTQGNIQASNGGVAAYGIADLSVNGGGGGGTLTQIQVNGVGVPANNGIVNITAVSNSPGKIAIAGQQISIYGLGAAAYYGVGQVASSDTGLVTGGQVYSAISALPTPMQFKGSLGTGGTYTASTLPAAAASNSGWTLKVITDGTYRGVAAKVGDQLISDGTNWILIPSGDEPSGTVTSVGMSVPTGLSVAGSPITSSGTLAITFAEGYSIPTTAKQGNWDTAYSHATDSSRLTTAKASGFYKFATTAEGHIASVTAVAASDLTSLIGSTTYAPYNANGYLPLSGGTMANTNVVTNLNADLLDGNNLMEEVADWDSSVSSIFKSSENRATNAPTEDFVYGIHLRFYRSANRYFTDFVTSLYADHLWFRRHTENGYGSWFTILHSGNSSVSKSGETLTVKINGTSQSLTNTNTHRPIQLNGTEILGNNTTALNLKAGTGVSLTNSSGTVTFDNSGVRAATINGDYLRINTNGTNADLTIPYASRSTDTKTELLTGQEFIYRQTAGGGLTYKPSAAVLKRVLGNSVVWNQQMNPSTISPVTNVITNITYSNGIYTYTLNDQGSGIHGTGIGRQGFTFVSGHKYYYSCVFNITPQNLRYFYFRGTGTNVEINCGTDKNVKGIYTCQETQTASVAFIGFVLSGSSSGEIKQSNYNLIDLTLFFNGNIPEGLTAETFERDYGYLLANPEYNAGTIINNSAKAIESVGFNLWDEEWKNGYYKTYSNNLDGSFVYAANYVCCKNLIPILPNSDYYIKSPYPICIGFYGKDGSYLNNHILRQNTTFTAPNDAYYLTFYIDSTSYGTVYKGDITLNLSDSAKNGTYEPYKRSITELNLKEIKVKSPNIWDEEWDNCYWNETNQGVKTDYANVVGCNTHVPIAPNKTYYWLKPSGTGYMLYYDKNKTYLSFVPMMSSGTFTTPANCAYITFYVIIGSGATYQNNITINVSDTAVNGKYFPHGTLTFNGLKQAGSVRDERVGKKFIQRVGSVDLGSIPSWRIPSTYTYIYIRADGWGGANGAKWPASSVPAEITSGRYTRQAGTLLGDYPENEKMIGFNAFGNLYIQDSSFTGKTIEQISDYLSGIMFYYELATPIEYEIIDDFPTSYPIDVLGTERVVSEELVAPFVADIQYGAEQRDIAYDINNLHISAGLLSNRASALESYFTDGIANNAARLSNTSAIGSTTKPVYFTANGVPSACSDYAGGTAVTLNGSSKAASTASFYAPTGAGSNGNILQSTGGTPSWVAQSTLVAGKATILETKRTLWGQDFNGSANVTGNMTNVGDITPSTSLSKNIGSDSLQFYKIYASRYYTGSGSGMIFAASNSRYRWYDSDTLGAETLLMELRRSTGLVVDTDVHSTRGVAARGIADLSVGGGGAGGTVTSITAGTGLSGGTITMNGTIALKVAGTTEIGGIQIGFSESNSGSASNRNYAVQLSNNKAFVNVPWTETTDSTVVGWGYKKGMVYTTSTPSESSIQVATGADPTYQYVTNTSQSTLILVVTTSNAAANSYGVHRYVMIYNNRNSATLVQFADYNEGVIGPADNVTIPANSYMEFRIIHPASNAKCMVTWSTPLKDIETM